MDHEPPVSILIRTCTGREQLLSRCLASVRSQDYGNIEIVVVQDGGNSAADIVSAAAKENPRFKYEYRSIPKSGRCIAGNCALELARGEYLNFLDDDDEFFPQHVSTLVKWIVVNEHASAAYSRSYQLPTTIVSLNPLVIEEGSLTEPNLPHFTRWGLCFGNFAPIQSVLFHRELYEQWGGFDEELDMFEDWNLWTKYFSRRDICHCESFTSFFRIPNDPRDQRSRSRQFRRFSSLALQKQYNIDLRITPMEFQRIVNEAKQAFASVPARQSVFDLCSLLLVRLISTCRAQMTQYPARERIMYLLTCLSESPPLEEVNVSVGELRVVILEKLWRESPYSMLRHSALCHYRTFMGK